jgi:hypothetical protein
MSLITKGCESDVEAVEENATICEVTKWHILCQQLKKHHEVNLTRIYNELGRDGIEVKMGVT